MTENCLRICIETISYHLLCSPTVRYAHIIIQKTKVKIFSVIILILESNSRKHFFTSKNTFHNKNNTSLENKMVGGQSMQNVQNAIMFLLEFITDRLIATSMASTLNLPLPSLLNDLLVLPTTHNTLQSMFKSDRLETKNGQNP